MDWTVDWTMDWDFLYEMSCLTTIGFATWLERDEEKVLRDRICWVVPLAPIPLDIYSCFIPITTIICKGSIEPAVSSGGLLPFSSYKPHIKATPDVGTPFLVHDASLCPKNALLVHNEASL